MLGHLVCQGVRLKQLEIPFDRVEPIGSMVAGLRFLSIRGVDR
jgi:hypothetical protein